jgi:hypothetical protein
VIRNRLHTGISYRLAILLLVATLLTGPQPVAGIDPCLNAFHKTGRQNRTIFLDHGLQMGTIHSLYSSVGLKFFRQHMIMAGYQVGRQEYDSEYIIPLCRECIFFFHGLWAGYGFEIVRQLSHDTGLFVNPQVWGGAEFVANRGLLPLSNSAFLMNPALKPGLLLGYYHRKLDIYLGLNYIHWLPEAKTTRGNALVDEQTGQPLKWEMELFPGRKGLNVFAGVRYTVF